MAGLILLIACILAGLSAGLFIVAFVDWWNRRNQ